MKTDPPLIVFDVLVLIFAIFISIIYFKSKIFHSYPYYFNIFFIITILLNNAIRLMPVGEKVNEYERDLACYIQGISLTVLDKLILCEITTYSIIYYLGVFFHDFYEENQMLIFLFLSEAGFIISLILAIVFSIPGMSVKSQYCYVRTNDETKKIVDTTVTTVLWAICLYCTIRLLINLIKIKRNSSLLKTKAETISSHMYRFILNIIFVIVMFLHVILLINKKYDNVFYGKINYVKDLIFLILCFLGEIFFTVNIKVLNETKRIITCKPPSLEISNDDENSLALTEEAEMAHQNINSNQ